MAYTANISWNSASGAVNYTVEYKMQSDSTWILAPGTNPTTNTTYAIPGLDEGTAYDFRITTNCSTGQGQQTIPGTTPCPGVIGLSAGFSGGVANLVWNRITGAVSYSVEYKIQSDSAWTVAPGSPVTNPSSGTTVTFNINGLAAGNIYDFRVTTNCRVGTGPAATTSASYACPPVTNLQVSFT